MRLHSPFAVHAPGGWKPQTRSEYGEHGVERRKREERGREKRLHSPFALHAPIQWAMRGNVMKGRGRSNGAGMAVSFSPA